MAWLVQPRGLVPLIVDRRGMISAKHTLSSLPRELGTTVAS